MDFEQITFFDLTMPTIAIDKPIRLIELFAGVGSTAQALRDLGANYEHWRVCEIDKYAISSYNSIFGTDFEVTDIKDLKGNDLEIVDTEDYCYILTYSFPCQDLSICGRQAGMKKGSGTRSGLLWEVERLLLETEHLPQILIMENVPTVHSQENLPDFKKWIDFLESKGYSNYWQDLNSRDYGIPQNRERCFMVSILGKYNYKFPKRIALEQIMRDYLEETVDDKYYITTEKAKTLVESLIHEGKILNESQGGVETVDLSFSHAATIDVANAICRRYDAGIVLHKYEHPGVSQWAKLSKGRENGTHG